MEKLKAGERLERVIQTKSRKVQILKTEGEGEIIEETEGKEPTEVRAGMGATDSVKENGVKLACSIDRKVKEPEDVKKG